MSEYKVPYTFIAGTRAKASQVNKNFEYLTDSVTELDNSKAARGGDPTINFSVAEPVNAQHAVTKRYVDAAIQDIDGSSGSGVGKSMFEVFHTLSTKTPPGAFSLRNGEVIYKADEDYPSFWQALEEQGTGIISDLTDEVLSETSKDDSYAASFSNITSIENSETNGRAFSPYSWITAMNAPTATEPIIAELELPKTITCKYFKLNSHVIDTYNSYGTADAKKAVKVGSISLRQPDGNWVSSVIINETDIPTSNERYFENTKPELEFNAIRLIIAENFGSNKTDVSVYPVDPDSTAVRVVPEEQWQWEVDTYGETGSFVIDYDEKSIKLPKITRFLTGVSDLWQVGMAEYTPISNYNGKWKDADSSDETSTEESSIVPLNAVSTGLWIQVYNAVAEDALSNTRYIPFGTLFEERLFRFVPDETSGWFVSDGTWKDGNYFEDAMTELLNQYAKAVTPSGKNYKLAPNGMRFVEDSLYTSTYNSYGEVPYYVLDVANYKFKTPMSDNYERATHTIDNTGDLLLDSASKLSGGLTSTSSEELYGVSAKVQPKSSYKLLCVFLGNEVPQSSSVDIIKRIKDVESDVSTIQENETSTQSQIDSLKEKDTSLEGGIKSNSASITSIESKIESLEATDSALTQSINEIKDTDSLINSQLSSVLDDIDELEQSVQDVTDLASSLDVNLSTAEEKISSLETSVDSIKSVLTEAEKNISSLEESVASLKEDNTTNKSDISELKNVVASKVDSSQVDTQLDERLSTLSFKIMTQEEYDALESKDENTMYIIKG